MNNTWQKSLQKDPPKVGQFKAFFIEQDMLGVPVSRAVWGDLILLSLCFWCYCKKLSKGKFCMANLITPENGASQGSH